MKNSYLTVTDGNDKTEELGSNAKYIRVQREEYACMLYEIRLCAYFSQSERFWYGICGVLVPIFHVQVRYY